MTRRIYVDTNILVAYFTTGTKAETANKKILLRAFKLISELDDVELCLSMWTITEFVKVMINEKDKKPKEVNKFANELIKKPVIGSIKLKFISVCPDSEYTFDSLFFSVRETMTLYNPGFGDAFHGVIMKNNKIKEILSLDGKDDFKIIPEITVIKPSSFIKPVLTIEVIN